MRIQINWKRFVYLPSIDDQMVLDKTSHVFEHKKKLYSIYNKNSSRTEFWINQLKGPSAQF